MHAEILTADQIAVLERVKPLRALRRFYLAGGTALGLRHGHRRSVDFDWFRPDAFSGRRLTTSLEDRFGAIERLPSGPSTLYVRLYGVTASFFKLPYELLEPVEPTPWGFGLASDRDIAAMKLEAIAGRGARKDFVDLYLLCTKGLALEAIFDLFERKYGAGRIERYHRLRALAYFDDAEREPMPDMIAPIAWADVRAFFEKEAARHLGEGIAG